MKKINDVNTALNAFQEAAQTHGEATESGDYKTANKSYDIIMKAVRLLKEQDAILSLLPLLDHSSDGVKCWAASYLLSICESEASQVLTELSKNKGLVSLNAEMTLIEWRKGNLEM